MNITYTFNNAFVPQVATGITSICENNKDFDSITFYLISLDVSDENKSKLKKLVDKYKRNVKIIEIPPIESLFDFNFDTFGWNSIILARLLIDKLLPEHVDKVLYLDADTLVRGNLSELWNMDLQGKILGMSIEPTSYKLRKDELGLCYHPYYNSGVILINLSRFRKINAGKTIIDYYKSKKEKLLAPDQDAINVAMKDEIVTISPKYNFYNTFYQYGYKFFKKLMNPIEYVEREIFEDALKNPVINHYLGEEKPWRKGNHHKYKNDYKKYLNMTDWKDTPNDDRWQLYLTCYYIFNLLMKPFPALRYKITTSGSKIYLKIRAKKK